MVAKIDAKDLLIQQPGKSKLQQENSQVPKSESLGEIEERMRHRQGADLPRITSDPGLTSSSGGAAAEEGLSIPRVESGTISCQKDWEQVEEGEDPLS